MILLKYKKINLGFIIFKPFLQIINFDGLIL